MAPVEPASAADLPGVLALLRRCGLTDAGVDETLDLLLVVRDEGRIIGSAAIERYGAVGLLRSVAVDGAHRGRGLGHALAEQAIEQARARGIVRLYLLTETAGAWFPRFGFAPVDRRTVAPEVRQSIEFRSACSETATVMVASWGDLGPHWSP